MRLSDQSPYVKPDAEPALVPQLADPLAVAPHPPRAERPTLPRVLCLAAQGERGLWRASGLVSALQQAGCPAEVAGQTRRLNLKDWDVIAAYYPYADLHLMDVLLSAHTQGLGVVLVLDEYLEKLPRSHPDFPSLGLTTPSRIKGYASALLYADVIVTHSTRLQRVLCEQGFFVRCIPESWSDPDGRWQKPPRSRHTLNLGWINCAGQLEDVASIRQDVLRVMREFPHLQLVIAGDDAAYNLFEALPASRRLYLPSTAADDLPFVYGLVDILLMPLRDTAFNRSLSDQHLMNAGLRGIPWLASLVPAYKEWEAGGILTQSLNNWYLPLRNLVSDCELRARLAAQGRQQALDRHASRIVPLWLDTLKQAALFASRWGQPEAG